MNSSRILLIDDHAMFRTGLRMVLDAGLRGSEIYEASSLDGIQECAPGKIDVVLLDIQLDGLNGLEGIALLRRKWPQVPILMLSSQDAQETVDLALTRGATGFVSKTEAAETIIGAIQEMLHGQFSNLPVNSLPLADKGLTPRQSEVLSLLHQGLSNKLIARRLTLSDNTVRRHVQGILEFFQVMSRAEAVFAARQQGLLR